jgi:hypothetical protein
VQADAQLAQLAGLAGAVVLDLADPRGELGEVGSQLEQLPLQGVVARLEVLDATRDRYELLEASTDVAQVSGELIDRAPPDHASQGIAKGFGYALEIGQIHRHLPHTVKEP